MNKMRKKLSILIPTFNEQKTIGIVLEQVLKVHIGDLDREIILIDDCSTDSTKDIVTQFINSNKDLKIILHSFEKNQGKGAAIQWGIEHVTGDYVIVQDADLEYDPREYINLLQPLIEDKADVVFGSRFMSGHPHRVLFFWHSVGNAFLTLLSNILTDLNLTDMETCYKLFKTDVIKSINLKENRFGFEPEVTAKIAKISGIRIYEVGISYYGRTYAEGKKINWKDGFRAIYCIIKYNLGK